MTRVKNCHGETSVMTEVLGCSACGQKIKVVIEVVTMAKKNEHFDRNSRVCDASWERSRGLHEGTCEKDEDTSWNEFQYVETHM